MTASGMARKLSRGKAAIARALLRVLPCKTCKGACNRIAAGPSVALTIPKVGVHSFPATPADKPKPHRQMRCVALTCRFVASLALLAISCVVAPVSLAMNLVPDCTLFALLLVSVLAAYTFASGGRQDCPAARGPDACTERASKMDLETGASAASGRSPACLRQVVPSRRYLGRDRPAGFNIPSAQLPSDVNRSDLDALTARVRASCSETAGLSEQQAIRLLLGCGLDIGTASDKAREVAAWRSRHGMSQVRQGLAAQLRAGRQVSFPHHDDMCGMMVVNPCAIVTLDGRPVTVWHVGTASAAAAGRVQPDSLAAWSRTVFEYVDLWVFEQSEQTRQLAGHIQVFNLEGLSVWHLAASASLGEKLKAAFSAAEYYVESTSHIYMVNSSPLFSRVWKAIQGLVAPRTVSKITVATDVPEDLLAALSLESAAKLMALLRTPNPAVPVLRPL